MTLTTDDPIEILRRKAVIFILGVMIVGGIIASFLHSLEAKTHPISLIIPPVTVVICLSTLIYLLRYPQEIYLAVQIVLGWGSFIVVFPEYFFVIEAFLNPDKLLIDSLPPISSGIFLLTTSMIVFLRPKRLLGLIILLWVFIASPIVIYLIFHFQELKTPRGIDLIVTLVPAMGINIFLVTFYARLQDAFNQICMERFHFKEVSEKDALTGSFNRGAGEKILQNLIDQREQSIGIILCDIDRFKQVNDNYGHLIGDLVLQTIARCCQAHLRKQDILIRWGGEEFVIVVTGDSQQELENLAERLRFIIAEQQIPEVGRVTASFGVAILEPHENLIQLFARADRALYQAKDWGRNQVVLA